MALYQIPASGTCFGIGRSQEEASFMTDEVEDLPRVSNKRRLLRNVVFQTIVSGTCFGIGRSQEEASFMTEGKSYKEA